MESTDNLLDLIRQLIAVQQPASQPQTPSAQEPGKFDQAMARAGQYAQLAQLIGGLQQAFSGQPLPGGGLPGARPVQGLAPTGAQFSGLGSGDDAQLRQLLALLTQR